MRLLTLSGSIVCLSLASAQAAQPIPVMVDSTGQTVGAITGEGLVTLKLKPSSEVVQMQVAVDRLGRETNEYYANFTCTGPVYLTSRALIRNAYLKQGDPNTIIFADVTAAPVKVKAVKFGSNCYSRIGMMAYPALQVGVDQQQLTPPFSVKFQ